MGDTPPSAPRIISWLGATLLITLPPYLLGYSYVQGYFGRFGIGFLELDMPQDQILVNALTASMKFFEQGMETWNHETLYGLGVLGVMAVLVAVRMFRNRVGEPDAPPVRIAPWMMVVAYLVLLATFIVVGQSTGKAEAESHIAQSQTRPGILLLVSDPEARAMSIDRIGASIVNDRDDSLIHISDSTFFVLRRAFTETGLHMVLRVPRSDELAVATYISREASQE